MEDLQNLMTEGMDNDPSTMPEDGFAHDTTGDFVSQSQANPSQGVQTDFLNEENSKPSFEGKLNPDETEFDSGADEFLNSDNVLKSSVI